MVHLVLCCHPYYQHLLCKPLNSETSASGLIACRVPRFRVVTLTACFRRVPVLTLQNALVIATDRLSCGIVFAEKRRREQSFGEEGLEDFRVPPDLPIEAIAREVQESWQLKARPIRLHKPCHVLCRAVLWGCSNLHSCSVTKNFGLLIVLSPLLLHANAAIRLLCIHTTSWSSCHSDAEAAARLVHRRRQWSRCWRAHWPKASAHG